jgi:uncharacterized protein (TIGR01777 family)
VRVAVTGSHGLIGSSLVRALEQEGHQVTRLVRGGSAQAGTGKTGIAVWDPARGTIDAAALEGHDAAVHLAGAGIGDHRWTSDYKATVRDSRVKGTTLLAATLASLKQPPAVLVSGSGVHYYGDRGDEELTESSGPGTGFLAGVVQEWEAATAAASSAGIRVVNTRSAVVLTPEGGSLRRLLLPFKLGLGGRLGSGRQWFSWVSLDDEIGALRHAMTHESVRGPVNVAAPDPVTNADFTRTLGAVLRRPTIVPVPLPVVRLRFGRELVAELLLGSVRVLPKALEQAGYEFRAPTLRGALESMLGRGRRAG